jgi:hypothetical protein
MQCDQFRQLAESYLNDELIVETNHELIAHLEHCSDCRHELTARRELRSKLRMAFTSAPENQMRPEFASRLRDELRERALRTTQDRVDSTVGLRSSKRQPTFFWVGLAACLILAGGLGFVLFRQRLMTSTYPVKQETTRNETPLQTEIARSAVGDHRDCAVHFRLSEKPIDLEGAGQKYDPVYVNLRRVVFEQANSPLAFELLEAHSCVFESRRFAHIVLKYHDRLVSLLVTDNKQAIDGPATNAPSPSQSQVIACSQFDGYQVSCFQTKRHAVFVVSDMSEGENRALARALAPSVFAHINRIEGAV